MKNWQADTLFEYISKGLWKHLDTGQSSASSSLLNKDQVLAGQDILTGTGKIGAVYDGQDSGVTVLLSFHPHGALLACWSAPNLAS